MNEKEKHEKLIEMANAAARLQLAITSALVTSLNDCCGVCGRKNNADSINSCLHELAGTAGVMRDAGMLMSIEKECSTCDCSKCSNNGALCTGCGACKGYTSKCPTFIEGMPPIFNEMDKKEWDSGFDDE